MPNYALIQNTGVILAFYIDDLDISTGQHMIKRTLFCAGLLFCFLQTAFASNGEAIWPPEPSAKVPGNAAEYPTTLTPINQSLSTLLNNGGKVINAYIVPDGPVVTLKKGKVSIICMVIGPNPSTDQNVATSRCYALN